MHFLRKVKLATNVEWQAVGKSGRGRSGEICIAQCCLSVSCLFTSATVCEAICGFLIVFFWNDFVIAEAWSRSCVIVCIRQFSAALAPGNGYMRKVSLGLYSYALHRVQF